MMEAGDAALLARIIASARHLSVQQPGPVAGALSISISGPRSWSLAGEPEPPCSPGRCSYLGVSGDDDAGSPLGSPLAVVGSSSSSSLGALALGARHDKDCGSAAAGLQLPAPARRCLCPALAGACCSSARPAKAAPPPQLLDLLLPPAKKASRRDDTAAAAATTAPPPPASTTPGNSGPARLPSSAAARGWDSDSDDEEQEGGNGNGERTTPSPAPAAPAAADDSCSTPRAALIPALQEPPAAPRAARRVLRLGSPALQRAGSCGGSSSPPAVPPPVPAHAPMCSDHASAGARGRLADWLLGMELKLTLPPVVPPSPQQQQQLGAHPSSASPAAWRAAGDTPCPPAFARAGCGAMVFYDALPPARHFNNNSGSRATGRKRALPQAAAPTTDGGTSD